MKGWLLDTNVVASLSSIDGAPSVKTWASAQDEDRLYLSILTLAEFDQGIARLKDGDSARARYQTRREALKDRFRGRILSLDDAAVRLWGEISGRVRPDSGHPPPVIDTLIAATAICASLYLVTRNVRDVAQSGALVFNPWDGNPKDFALTTP